MLNILRWLWQQLLPAPCLWCSLPVPVHQHYLCPACHQALPQFELQLCHFNLLWLPAVSTGLPDTHFNRLLSLGWYQQPYQYWIQRWKFHADIFAAALLQQLFLELVARYQASGQPLPEAIVYVPMTIKKEKTRGFNQAKILAQHTANLLQVPLLHIFSRNKDGATQVGLNRQQRQKNLRGVFQLHITAALPQHLVLIDDVVTTGSTANQLAHLLKQHGVTEVSVWSLAITPAFTQPSSSGVAENVLPK